MLVCTDEPLGNLYSFEMAADVSLDPAKNAIFRFFDCLSQAFHLALTVGIAKWMGDRLIAPPPVSLPFH